MSIKSNILAWAKSHQKKDGQSWAGACQALMWRLCDYYGQHPDPTPINATRAGYMAFVKQRGATAATAPIGAFHYWELDGMTDGHVGIDLSGKGTEVFMASRHVTKSYGDAIGTISVGDYMRKTGARYLGWSVWNGSNGYVVKPKKN